MRFISSSVILKLYRTVGKGEILAEAKNIIIQTAMRLYCQKGVKGTSISDILEDSKTGKGQFYYYFNSKNDLTQKVIQSHIERWQTECFTGILGSGQSPKNKISEMLDWIYASHQNQIVHYGCPMGNLIFELSTEDETYRLMFDQWLKAWQNALGHCVFDLKQGSENEAQEAAEQMIASIQGSLLLLKINQNIDQLALHLKAVKEAI
ncbi:TetR/AcrR family transcriptional regulator [Lactococcus sp. dk322]|nr:TetR family transcriptional regulator [Lactococcus sp. dk101]TXK45194.1 TetR/AcrR family transcriptional regulator [Lactococcus sp. dk310]TXK51028.1 TetR/AcrR family transcriptional regulator [Lactococcus sp. dk322]